MEFDELTGHGEAEIVLDQTPFYAEGGGQVGDQGVLREPGGGSELFTVTDTQKPVGGLIVHRGTLHGRLRVGETVDAVVDADRRADTMRNHTGTHLLHRALRNVVGRARAPGRLARDAGLPALRLPVRPGLTDRRDSARSRTRSAASSARTGPSPSRTCRMAEAIEGGADAFFDEKYGETVRTIRVQDYSFELCGGTHCRASGQIGGFVITGERSIGSGMRRIEALTGVGRRRARSASGSTSSSGSGRGRRRPVGRRRRGPDRRAPGRAARGEAAAQGRRRRRRSRSRASSPAAAVEVAPGVRLVAAARPVRLDGRAQGRGPRRQRRPRVRRRRARPRRRRAAALRDGLRRPRRARDLGRRPRQGRDAGDRGPRRRTTGDGPGPGHAARGPARRPRRRSGPASSTGPDGLLAPHLAARRRARALAACTALDVGTEFAKALVFDIDAAGHGTVRGVGRKRQGLSHMQSGTVADIAAVVDNCAVALQEAEEMAGFRPTQVVIGIAGELVKGFTTTHSQERKKPDQPITEAELQKLIDAVQREALHEAERAITWETGPAPGRRPARPCRGDRRLDRRLRADQPGRLPGPPRQDRDLQRVRAARPPRGAPERRVAARPRAARDRRRAVCGRSRPRQRPDPPGRRAVRRRRRRDDGRRARPPGRHRRHADVRPRWPRLHQEPGRPPRPALPARRVAQGRLCPRLAVDVRDEVAAIVGRRRPGLGGRRGARDGGAVRRRPAAGPDLPVRRWVAPAGDRRRPRLRGVLPAAAVRPAARGHGDGARPDRDDLRRDRPAGRPAGRHAARAGLPGDRAADDRGSRSMSRSAASCGR